MLGYKVVGIGRPTFPRKQRDDICPKCRGFGYTDETAPVVTRVKKKLVTESLGSGCVACSGTGRV